MEEIWKDIEGYEGLYQISNLGRYRSVDRYYTVKSGDKHLRKGKVLKPIKCTNGYLEIHLSKNHERRPYLLHRVVAKHFIDYHDNLPEVNHKDEDITNCIASNLEWCTSKYNANYGTRNKRWYESNKKYMKPVNQLDLDGNYIQNWPSVASASRAFGIDDSFIPKVCKGKQPTAAGYKWEYANEVKSMTTKRYLKQIERFDRLIKNKQIEIERLEALLSTIPALPYDKDKIISSGSQDKLGDNVSKLLDSKAELKKMQDYYTDKRENIILQIENMPDNRHMIILSMLYLEKKELWEVPNETNYSYSYAKRLHSDALKEFERMYGSEYLKK